MSDTDTTTATETGTETTTTTDAATTDAITTQTADTATETVDWEAKYKETLAHSRKHETRAKENAAAAKELADLKAAQMSDQEKATAAAQAADERAAKAERESALLRAAIDHKLTKDDLELLDGVPADQINDRAKKLADRIKAAAPAGASGTEVGGQRTSTPLDEQLAEARKNGDLVRAIAIQQQMKLGNR